MVMLCFNHGNFTYNCDGTHLAFLFLIVLVNFFNLSGNVTHPLMAGLRVNTGGALKIATLRAGVAGLMLVFFCWNEFKLLDSLELVD